MFLRSALVLLGLFTVASAPRAELATAQSRGYVPTDYYALVTVGSVAVSPSGALVAFEVTRVVEEENRRHREIWMQALSGGRPEGAPYRFTTAVAEAWSPRWSPDGSVLTFLSERDGTASPWFLSVDGRGGEAYQIPGVRGLPVWSPDGEWIAFTAAPEASSDGEDPAGEARTGWIAPNAVTETLDARRFDGRVITSIRYKQDGTLAFRPHFSTVPKKQLHVVAGAGGTPVQLGQLDFDASEPTWSSDGRLLFFDGDSEEDNETNEEETRSLWVVAREGGGARRLAIHPGAEWDPAISPDGQWLAYRYRAGRGQETDIYVTPLDGSGNLSGVARNLTEEWSQDPGAPEWSADSRFVRFEARVGGDVHLMRTSLAGGGVQQITTGSRTISSGSYSADDAVLAFASTDAITPTELFVAQGDASGERRASKFNDDWLANVVLEHPEVLQWSAADGTRIEGWLIPPVGYRAGTSYPMVLKIHGGPHSAYGNTFFPTFHVLSAAGFFVLYINPRGSAGYGHAFQYATRGAWGVVDKEDFLAAVDLALSRHADIDARRIGVSGGSYGGFMTNWLTATTDRFAAAVTSRSISNWESWYGSSDAQGLTDFEFFGPPWEQRELYRRLSPISYVENVQAPTLIIHSENDYRTPIGDGEQWFLALKKRGVPTELVRYPRSSHGLSRTGEPWLLVDRLERLRSWFGHFIGNGAARAQAAR